mmetsp:Transcript_23280/g.39792  ORF Transcript_23280/g.39792 Transcript_23280/m.39792 type:complete len:340 (+) Transcript_23280:200-1219(+)
MYPNSVIEILLRGTHLHGNGHSLDHLPGTVRGHVTSHHALRFRFHDEFEERVGFALGEGVLHGTETVFVHVDIAKLGHGLLFGVSDGTNFRRGEDGGGDVFVVHGPIHAAEESVGKTVSFHQGHGSQGHAIGNVSNGVDAGNVGLRVLIDRDECIFSVNSSGVKVESINLSLASRGIHNGIAFQFIPILIHHNQCPIILFDNLLRIRVKLNINAGITLHLLLQMSPHIHIKSPEEQIPTIHKGNIASQSIHDTRKLQRNESSTHNNNTLWLFFQIENLIGGNGVLNSRNGRFERPSAHGNEDVFGRDDIGFARGRVMDGDGVGTREGTGGFDDFYAGIF